MANPPSRTKQKSARGIARYSARVDIGGIGEDVKGKFRFIGWGKNIAASNHRSSRHLRKKAAPLDRLFSF